ncbi:MAG: tRNA uridine(34) 5-carboxymethylaminomethyl modification radical SAM/GNAT enzyme Elp3 [Candidatus Woesearchaeota archaeon]|jgi:elongator complex protein 3
MSEFYPELLKILLRRNLSLKEFDQIKRDLSRKYNLKEVPTNIQILLHANKQEAVKLRPFLLSKPVRSLSGVAPVAIMTQPFPCPHGKCIMCPGGVKSAFGNVPQSYTGTEPATMRGIHNDYDPYLQVMNRLEQYILLGHNCEKVELIVMGGTFPSFPKPYQEKFIKFAFKAMNDFSQQFYYRGELNYLKFKQFFELPAPPNDTTRIKRVKKKMLALKGRSSLIKEQKRNETSTIKAVALCIETRPDYGLLIQGNEMLRLGCTRVELGIQSVYDKTLQRIQRGHTTLQTQQSIQILKDLGFKVAGHYMPGLPGLSKEEDLKGMIRLFSDQNYRPDMLKIYPCMVAKGTKLYKEYQQGKFKPLVAEDAAEMIFKFKKYVPEYCRIMRIQRDIPSTQIVAGVKMTNLRQYLHQTYPVNCRCIRCREPKGHKISWKDIKIKVNEYDASQGEEFFISAEDIKNDLLIGFIRMRFPSTLLRKEITKNSALIRELHVYGTATAIGEEGTVQHRGWGKKLMKTAEEIARKYSKTRMVIISGIGVRNYYRKLGYRLEGPYMIKKI